MLQIFEAEQTTTVGGASGPAAAYSTAQAVYQQTGSASAAAAAFIQAGGTLPGMGGGGSRGAIPPSLATASPQQLQQEGIAAGARGSPQAFAVARDTYIQTGGNALAAALAFERAGGQLPGRALPGHPRPGVSPRIATIQPSVPGVQLVRPGVRGFHTPAYLREFSVHIERLAKDKTTWLPVPRFARIGINETFQAVSDGSTGFTDVEFKIFIPYSQDYITIVGKADASGTATAELSGFTVAGAYTVTAHAFRTNNIPIIGAIPFFSSEADAATTFVLVEAAAAPVLEVPPERKNFVQKFGENLGNLTDPKTVASLGVIALLIVGIVVLGPRLLPRKG